MIFSRIGNSLTRSRNVINRACGFGAPTVNGCLNQFNRRFLRNLTAIRDGKKMDSGASSSLGLDYLAANGRFYHSASPGPKNMDHMKNELKSGSRNWVRTEFMIYPAKDDRYTILSQGKRRYVLTKSSASIVFDAFFWTWFIMRISFAIGSGAFLLALWASLMDLPIPTIPPALFTLILSPLLLPFLRFFGLPLFVRIFGRK